VKFLAGAILGSLVSLMVAGGLMMSKGGEMMFVEKESPYSYDETVQKVEESYKKHGWQVLSVKDTGAEFVKNGKPPIGKVTNMKVCSAPHAYKLLSKDENKHIVTMMPCGVGIYEKNGKVYVATMNLNLMKNFFKGDVKDTMALVAQDGEKVMSVLNKR
jgi:uncharacterized protein (DUF302 family)